MKYRWLVIAAWLALAMALAVLVPPPDSTVGETADLLPDNTPVHIALDQLAKHFGDKSGLSNADVIFECADAPLTSKDLADVEAFARQISQSKPEENVAAQLATLSIRTPASLAFTGKSNPLISEDGKAALIDVSLPYNFLTKDAARVVKHMQETLAAFSLQRGLSAAVTGSAGYGYDYAIATERSHQKTMVVTLISVICILLLIYRAPLAAMIPLAGISVAAVVVMKILSEAEHQGFHSGTAERIFTFVLLYGAGVDYSLLFISRYREFLDAGNSSAEAVVKGLSASVAAVASSTVMTVSGLVMLCFARFNVFRHAGPAVVLALVVTSAAALTLVPAILAIVGSAVFWPGHKKASAAAEASPSIGHRFWAKLSDFVVQHPATVLLATLAVLALPAIRGSDIVWNYDALSSLKSSYQARRGTEMVERHWPVGETAPVTVVVVAKSSQPFGAWMDLSSRILQSVRKVDGVDNVRALNLPLGLHVPAAENAAVLLFAREKASAEFLSADNRAIRLSVILNTLPLNRVAMNDVTNIASAARATLETSKVDGTVYVAGSTAEMMDVRTITQEDFHRIAAMALTAILIIVSAVLRDVVLSIFILAATALSYLTTLGITFWVFGLTGAGGLEWKVQMLLFIVLVAVGQDYSIFFAVRFAQESHTLNCKDATRRSLIFTGPVISSCGLIMAATLGSVMAGDIQLLVQLGFAFALGMLIDTFIVRPLLLPAFIVLTNRNLKHAAKFVG